MALLAGEGATRRVRAIADVAPGAITVESVRAAGSLARGRVLTLLSAGRPDGRAEIAAGRCEVRVMSPGRAAAAGMTLATDAPVTPGRPMVRAPTRAERRQMIRAIIAADSPDVHRTRLRPGALRIDVVPTTRYGDVIVATYWPASHLKEGMLLIAERGEDGGLEPNLTMWGDPEPGAGLDHHVLAGVVDVDGDGIPEMVIARPFGAPRAQLLSRDSQWWGVYGQLADCR